MKGKRLLTEDGEEVQWIVGGIQWVRQRGNFSKVNKCKNCRIREDCFLPGEKDLLCGPAKVAVGAVWPQMKGLFFKGRFWGIRPMTEERMT